MGIDLNSFVSRKPFLPISWVFQVYIGNLVHQIPNFVSKLIFIYYLIMLSFISIEVHLVALQLIKHLVCIHFIGYFGPFHFNPWAQLSTTASYSYILPPVIFPWPLVNYWREAPCNYSSFYPWNHPFTPLAPLLFKPKPSPLARGFLTSQSIVSSQEMACSCGENEQHNLKLIYGWKVALYSKR